MNRGSLVFVFAVVVLAFPVASRAADPAGSGHTDPFAPTEPTPPSIEDQEAAVLGAPAKATPPPPAPTPRAAAPGRRQRDDEDRAAAPAAVKAPDQTGVAIGLSTSGFASGALDGGLFVGGRTPGGMIIGGFVDYGMTSVTSMAGVGIDLNSSMQFFRLGVGVREGFLRTADRRVELYGLADASFDYRNVEIPAMNSGIATNTWSAAGFSLALGPGVRLWVTDQLSIGYVARFRLGFLSGDAGALSETPTDNASDAKLTRIGFDGVFQILAIF